MSQNIEMNVKTIYSIILKTFGEKSEEKWSKIGITLLSLIYDTKHKIKLLSVFKNEDNRNEKILVKSENGDINIFGEKYLYKKRKELINE